SRDGVTGGRESRWNNADGNCCGKVNVTNASAHGKAGTNGKTASRPYCKACSRSIPRGSHSTIARLRAGCVPSIVGGYRPDRQTSKNGNLFFARSLSLRERVPRSGG